MPLEGHWQRQQTPLRATTPRERRLVVAIASAVAAAAVALGAVAVLRGEPHSAAGCVDVTAAGTMGANTLHLCGNEAATWCRNGAQRAGTATERALAACREAGYR